MRKLYNIDNNELGIDFNSVLCFYVDGKVDTYHGFNGMYLNILIGNKIGEPNKIKLDYYHVGSEGNKCVNIYKNGVRELYLDLITYFNKNAKE